MALKLTVPLPTQPDTFPERPPPQEIFFSPLEVTLDPLTLERVRFAYQASKYGHAGQKREDNETRYFDHPKGAAWIYIFELGGRDADIIIIILLHDLSEDQYLLSPYRIALNFGEKIALDIRAITKLKRKLVKGKLVLRETPLEYIHRVIARGPQVIVGKLCDRLHNCRTLKNRSREKQLEQVAETDELYLGVLIPALREHDGTWSEYADKLELLILAALQPYR